ncbi:hypothetical protein ACKGJI_04780 [Sulfurospirillum sp. 1307]|jgi:predicted membrane-bound spermidine synthase
MTRKHTAFEKLISLLQGASWAFAFLGGVTLYSFFSPFGLVFSLLAAFIGSLAGLFLVIILEIANIQFEKLYEIKKQTKLLEKIDEKLSNN